MREMTIVGDIEMMTLEAVYFLLLRLLICHCNKPLAMLYYPHSEGIKLFNDKADELIAEKRLKQS